jgi:hypothetical protein
MTDFDHPYVDRPGAIKLADVLGDDFDFSGITVRADDASLNSFFTIGTDKIGDDAILYTYYGDQDAWDAVYPAATPEFTIKLYLCKEGFTDTAIQVGLSYFGSQYY